MIAAARLIAARLHLRALGLAYAGSTSALLTIASARRPSLSVSQLLADPAAMRNEPMLDRLVRQGDGARNACVVHSEPAGHRVTLRRPRFLRPALVIRTNANPDHASALLDLRHQFRAVTGSDYLPRRGDLLTHEVT